MIETSTALARLVTQIEKIGRIGIDTEADSLHCYHEKVCLLQIGLPDTNELVDPLADLNLAPLLDALSRQEIVLHGADFDLRMLYRLGLKAPRKVFDTVLAARLTGATKFGYAALVAEHFDVTLPKGSQKANWASRPLPAKMAAYAGNDTHYLLPLAELFEQRLVELGRLPWLEQSSERAITAARVVRERDPDTVWRVRGSNVLGPRAAAVLRALWRWREDEARADDRPPFRIFSNEDLIDSAQVFDSDKAISRGGLRGARKERFERAAREALALDSSEWPVRVTPKRRPRMTDDQQKRLVTVKRQRDRVAAELAIAAELIAPRAELERIAIDGNAGMDALLPWQQRLLRQAS